MEDFEKVVLSEPDYLRATASRVITDPSSSNVYPGET